MTQSRPVHGSTTTARLGECLVASSAVSPCGNGVSLRQDITRCIFVSVMNNSALGTSPFTNGQRQRINNVSTITTSLTTRKKAIHLHERFSIPVALVFKKPNKCTHRCIIERASKAVVSHHPAQVKVFNADGIKSSHNVSGNFVEMVKTRIGNARVDTSYFETLTLAPFATLDAPRKDALCLGEFEKLGIEKSGINNVPTIRESGKSVNSKIDSGCCASLWQRLNWFIENKCHKIPPIFALGYRHGGGGAHESSRPMNVEPTELGNFKISINNIPSKGAFGIFSRLFTSFLFERWIPGALLKEIAKCNLEMTKRLLSRNARYFVKPHSLRLPFKLRESGRRSLIINPLPAMIGIRTEAKRPVVDESTSSKGACQNTPLGGCRIKTKSAIHLHRNKHISVRGINQLLNLKGIGQGHGTVLDWQTR